MIFVFLSAPEGFTARPAEPSGVGADDLADGRPREQEGDHLAPAGKFPARLLKLAAPMKPSMALRACSTLFSAKSRNSGGIS
jgi:hypothetical protein